MPEEVSINFYRITECGYYERGNNRPSFGTISTILNQLYSWVRQRGFNLEDTCTYETQPDNNYLHTYCYDIARNGRHGDYIVATWNETQTLLGEFASVEAQAPVGQASVHTTDVPDGTIPGYPTYFWFLPQRNFFATLRFGTNLNGHSNLKRYMRGFLEWYSDFVFYDEENDDQDVIIGYAPNEETEPDNYVAKFWSRPHRRRGEIEFIRQRRTEITKIIRRSSLSYGHESNFTLAQQFFQDLGITGEPEALDEKDIEYTLPFTPTAEQFEEMVGNWDREYDSPFAWDDYGFKIKGETEIRWFSSMLVKTPFILDCSRNNSGMIAAQDLLRAIEGSKEQIMATLERR